MSQAINIIKQEHLNYLALLRCLGHLVDDLERSDAPCDAELFHAFVDYIESFLNRYHHPKEDEHLFRALRRRWPESEELIRRLEAEHVEGDALLTEVKTALQMFEQNGRDSLPAFVEAVARYRAHQYEHMRAEEMKVLPLARKHLTAEDWRDIDAAFTAHRDPLFGDERRGRYRRLYAQIVDRVPAPYGFGDRGGR